MTAETLDGGQLRRAATLKGDDRILLKIQGKDCVALEVKYHERCYQSYTSVARYQKKESSSKVSYQRSFEVFCEQFVKPRIIDDEEIFRMRRIKREFVKIVAEVENEDASDYKTIRLKERMLKVFPQLVFHNPIGKNTSAIVYSTDMEHSKIVDNVACGESSQTSETEDSENGAEFNRNHKSKPSTTLQEMYNVAFALRTELKDNKHSR